MLISRLIRQGGIAAPSCMDTYREKIFLKKLPLAVMFCLSGTLT